MNVASRKIAPESYVLAAICLLDLGTTLFWVSYRDAAEGNPVMAFYLQHGGIASFIAAKFVLCAVPLFITEWARRTRPRFVENVLRFTIVAYLTLYGLGVAHVNQDSEPTYVAQVQLSDATPPVAP